MHLFWDARVHDNLLLPPFQIIIRFDFLVDLFCYVPRHIIYLDA
jgi:hypothetical protein